MPSALEILTSYKDTIRKRFRDFLRRPVEVPSDMAVPTAAAAALTLGIRLGRQEGFSEGLIVGTTLGLDVGMDVVDAMLSQPVIFGTPGNG